MLRCPGITQNAFVNLGKCQRIRVLRLTGFGFNASIPSPMPFLGNSQARQSQFLVTPPASPSSSSALLASGPISSSLSTSYDEGLPYSAIAELSNLCDLVLYNSLISNAAMRKIINNCPLDDVSLRCCPGISDELFDPPPDVAKLWSLVLLVGNVTDLGIVSSSTSR